MNVVAFSMLSVPDVGCGRRLHGLGDDLDDSAVVKVMQHRHLQAGGRGSPLPAHQRRPAVLSMVCRRGEALDLISLREGIQTERSMLGEVWVRASSTIGSTTRCAGPAPRDRPA